MYVNLEAPSRAWMSSDKMPSVFSVAARAELCEERQCLNGQLKKKACTFFVYVCSITNHSGQKAKKTSK